MWHTTTYTTITIIAPHNQAVELRVGAFNVVGLQLHPIGISAVAEVLGGSHLHDDAFLSLADGITEARRHGLHSVSTRGRCQREHARQHRATHVLAYVEALASSTSTHNLEGQDFQSVLAGGHHQGQDLTTP